MKEIAINIAINNVMAMTALAASLLASTATGGPI